MTFTFYIWRTEALTDSSRTAGLGTAVGGARKINHGSPPVRTTFLSPKGESVCERGLCALRWGVAIK